MVKQPGSPPQHCLVLIVARVAVQLFDHDVLEVVTGTWGGWQQKRGKSRYISLRQFIMYDICMYIYIYMYVCIYLCIYIYVYIFICIYIYMYVCNYVYIYIHILLCIYIYNKVQRIYATYIRIYDRCIAVYIYINIHINTLKKRNLLIYYVNYV